MNKSTVRKGAQFPQQPAAKKQPELARIRTNESAVSIPPHRKRFFGAIRRATMAASALLIVGAAPAHASPSALHFADLGGIRNFQADGDRGIYIEGRNRQWYHAEFFAPCIELRFHESVGFVIEPYGDLDKFSSIIVGGERCYFKSFERSEGPEATK